MNGFGTGLAGLLVLAVLLTLILVPAPAAAADTATYQLQDIKVYKAAPPPNDPWRIDKLETTPLGGYLECTARSTAQSGECVGAVQHFKFSWQFNKDVTTLAGPDGAHLFTMYTTWEGDSGTNCINLQPWVWIKAGGTYGPNPADSVNSETFKLLFMDPTGENRVYFNPDQTTGFSKSPTFQLQGTYRTTGGFEIVPAILGNSVHVVYVYNLVPGIPTATPTTTPPTVTAPATTALRTAIPTVTTVPPVTSVSTTAAPSPTRAVTPVPTATGAPPGGCSWTGTWSTAYGDVVLTQDGANVGGSYGQNNGIIWGTVSGNILTGGWSEGPTYEEPNDKGRLVFTIAPDCRSFSGIWGYGSDSTGASWTGTRGGGTTATIATTTTTAPATTAARTTPTGGRAPLSVGIAVAALACAGLVAFGRRERR